MPWIEVTQQAVAEAGLDICSTCGDVDLEARDALVRRLYVEGLSLRCIATRVFDAGLGDWHPKTLSRAYLRRKTRA